MPNVISFPPDKDAREKELEAKFTDKMGPHYVRYMRNFIELSNKEGVYGISLMAVASYQLLMLLDGFAAGYKMFDLSSQQDALNVLLAGLIEHQRLLTEKKT